MSWPISLEIPKFFALINLETVPVLAYYFRDTKGSALYNLEILKLLERFL